MASSSAPSRPAATPAKPPQAPRIIAGQWRRTPLKVADVPGLRPTPDRVRETAFNWISHQRGGSLEGASVLDLFAGTGALGLEAASRGAERVILVENHPAAVRALLSLRDKLDARHVEIVHADAVSEAQRLARRGARFAVLFLDPPYRQGWLARIVPTVARLVEPEGLVYAESEARLDAGLFADHGFELIRADKAGQVFYHLLRRRTGDDPGEDSPC